MQRLQALTVQLRSEQGELQGEYEALQRRHAHEVDGLQARR